VYYLVTDFEHEFNRTEKAYPKGLRDTEEGKGQWLHVSKSSQWHQLCTDLYRILWCAHWCLCRAGHIGTA